MSGVGEGDEVDGERWVPVIEVGVKSLDAVLDDPPVGLEVELDVELPVGESLEAELPVGESLEAELPVVGAVIFSVLAVGFISRLSNK